ncbi:hypothetical protein Tco_0388928 [Tanacetum coccineum]
MEESFPSAVLGFRSFYNLIYSMAGSDDEIPPPPPLQTPTQQAPHIVSTIKVPILKKVIKVLPPKTAEEILARERERKARTTLLMSLPEDHLAKFHKMTDAKDMISQGYDMFSVFLRFKLEIHGAGVSTEDANQKFLRSLPSSWSQVSPQNVAFVSSESTSSTNDVSTAYGVSTSSGYNSQREKISSYTDKVMDLKWYIVAMISIEIEECFYKKSGGRGKLHFDAKGNLIKRDTLDYNSKIMEGALENREEPKNLGSGHWNVTFVRKNGLSKLLKQADESKEKLELGMGDQYMMHVVVSPSNDEGKIIAFWNWNREVSNSSVETLEYVPEPVVVEPKVVSQPKVWSDAPIIEEYELDSDDEYVIQPSNKTGKEPSFALC